MEGAEMEQMKENRGENTGRAQRLEKRVEGGESGTRKRVEEAASPRGKGKTQNQSQAATTRKTSSVTEEPETQRLPEGDRHAAQNQQSLP